MQGLHPPRCPPGPAIFSFTRWGRKEDFPVLRVLLWLLNDLISSSQMSRAKARLNFVRMQVAGRERQTGSPLHPGTEPGASWGSPMASPGVGVGAAGGAEERPFWGMTLIPGMVPVPSLVGRSWSSHLTRCPAAAAASALTPSAGSSLRHPPSAGRGSLALTLTQGQAGSEPAD